MANCGHLPGVNLYFSTDVSWHFAHDSAAELECGLWQTTHPIPSWAPTGVLSSEVRACRIQFGEWQL